MVADGIRGVTANPTIFAGRSRAPTPTTNSSGRSSPAGTRSPTRTGSSSSTTSRDACAVLRPTFDDSDGTDGFVSIEVAPELARDTDATIAAARELHERIALAEPVRQDPGDRRRDPCDPDDDRRGPQHQRHADLLAAPIRRSHRRVHRRARGVRRGGGDLATVHSVASFFVSRVDTEVDRRLEALGTDEAPRPARSCRDRAGQARIPAVSRAVRR